MAPKKPVGHCSRKADANRYFNTPTVQIVVGTQNTQEFLIHRGLLCARSEFFKNALSGRWSETEKDFKLPEEDPEMFGLYQAFLYTNSLPIEDDESTLQDRYLTIGKLYVLCGKLLDLEGKETVLEAFHELCSNTDVRVVPNSDCVSVIYDGTTEKDPARAMLADVYTAKADKAALQSIPDSTLWPSDFFHDLCCGLLLQRTKERQTRAERDRIIRRLFQDVSHKINKDTLAALQGHIKNLDDK
ncbi:hypothetical protein M011DRAFT_473103 [Sporormia fimetaria CBS 119925]|uniref:BTB domain-containing protein n=1 Tax=Sporormia fimetaria CBS 119925 TaxID=1340428 RepID=A0A6A6VPT2_9PLEO|nr:hypothetical protein M011DRAFT_473103 [Sporormia fimetaria CBS 119925]